MAEKPRDYPVGIKPKGNKFAAFTSYLGQRNYLGSFDTVEEAVAAREVSLGQIIKELRVCPCCDKKFEVDSKIQRFCNPKCKGAYKYKTEKVTTESQYEEISGNWSRYLSRLLYAAGRKRDNLTREDLLAVLERQNYCCAISGLPLTCQLKLGTRVWSNASVDRIEAGGSYSKENIQLVCRSVNSWRSDMPLDLFKEVCKAVATHSQERLEV
jgi:hypothetical protein